MDDVGHFSNTWQYAGLTVSTVVLEGCILWNKIDFFQTSDKKTANMKIKLLKLPNKKIK